MKKITLVIAVSFIGIALNAQSNKQIKAWKGLLEYNQANDIAALNTAKQAIDEAAEHIDTKDQAKTWVYRAKVYQALFELNIANEKQKSTGDPYATVATTEIETAIASLKKAKELDVKKSYTDDYKRFIDFAYHMEMRGAAMYNGRNFEGALPAFESAMILRTEQMGSLDTTSLFNASLCAERINNNAKLKEYGQKLVDAAYKKPAAYSLLIKGLLGSKTHNDSLAAFDAVGKARKLFPDDLNLLITETNFFIIQSKNTEALANLKLAIQKSPQDYSLHYYMGNVYDNLGNPKDPYGNDLQKPANFNEMLSEAEKAYKSAIELKPDYFDAIYNLGVLYNNKGVYISKQADGITDQAKYKAEGEKANKEFVLAIPYLEKALGLFPDDVATLSALKQLYARTGQVEKMQQTTDKLKSLGQ